MTVSIRDGVWGAGRCGPARGGSLSPNGDCHVPGKPVTDQQVRTYMQDRLRHSQRAAAARAGFSERTARRIEAEARRPVDTARIGMRRGDVALRPQHGARRRRGGGTGDTIELQRKLESRTLVRRHQSAPLAQSRQAGRLA